MESETRQYLDGQFDSVHKKIDKVRDDTFDAIGNINHDLTRLQIDQMRCAQQKSQEMNDKIEKHEKDKHNLAKLLGIVVAIIGIVSGGAVLLGKLLN